MLYLVTLAFLLPEASHAIVLKQFSVWSPEGPTQALDRARKQAMKESCPLIVEGSYQAGRAVALSTVLEEVLHA